MTRTAAVTSMMGGFIFSMFWLLFVHAKEAESLGLCRWLTGKGTLVADAKGSWIFMLQWVDPNVVALPLSLCVALVVALATRPMDEEHIQECWKYM